MQANIIFISYTVKDISVIHIMSYPILLSKRVPRMFDKISYPTAYELKK